MTAPLVCTALGIEARAVRSGRPDATVAVVGMRGRRVGAAARAAASPGSPGVLLLGFGGGLRDGLVPGDVVVATAIDDGSAVVDLPAAEGVLGVLRRSGIAASAGVLYCSDHIVRGAERHALADRAIAVDMESAALLAAFGPRRLVVVRVIVDTPRQGLARASIFNGRRVWRALRTVAAVAAMAPDGYEATDRRVSTSGNVDVAGRATRASRASRVSQESLQAGAHVAGPTEEG